MRSQLLLLGVLGAGVAGLGTMVACSSSETHVIEIPDEGGTGNSTGDGGDLNEAGEPVYDLPSQSIDANERVLEALVGDQVIVRENVPSGQSAKVFAVPINGGPETEICTVNPATDSLIATLGAVAHWTNVDANGIGALDVWTPATGLKTGIAAKALAGVFASSDDGTRIAFVQEGTATTGNVAVRDLSSATNLVTLSGADAANLASAGKQCAPSLNFTVGASKNFFAFFCTGVDPAATNGRIYSVPGAANAVATRVDAAAAGADTVSAAQGIAVDIAGTKVTFVDGTTKAVKYVNVSAPGATIQVDTSGVFPFILGDGSAVVYAVPSNPDGGAGPSTIKKATTVATPVISTIGNVNGLGYVDSSPDGMKLIFAQTQNSKQGTTDLYLLDFTQASPTVQTLLASADGSEVGFTSDSNTVVWTDLSADTAMMRSLTLGGAAKDLVPGNGGLISDTGTDLVVFSNPVQATSGGTVFFDVGYTDAVAGGTTKTISIGNPASQAQILGKRLVYNRFINGDTGIFAIDLP